MGSPFFFQPSGTGSGGGGQGFTQYYYPLGVSQAVAVGISFMGLNSATFISGMLNYQIFRSATGPTMVSEIGNLFAFFNQGLNTWELSRAVNGTGGATFDPGVSFQIDANGLVNTTYQGWDSAGYTGYIAWSFMSQTKKPA